MNRREFIKLAGLGGVALAVPKSLIEAQPEIVADKPIENFASDVGGYLVPAEFHEILLKALRERGITNTIEREWPSRSVKIVEVDR